MNWISRVNHSPEPAASFQRTIGWETYLSGMRASTPESPRDHVDMSSRLKPAGFEDVMGPGPGPGHDYESSRNTGEEVSVEPRGILPGTYLYNVAAAAIHQSNSMLQGAVIADDNKAHSTGSAQQKATDNDFQESIVLSGPVAPRRNAENPFERPVASRWARMTGFDKRLFTLQMGAPSSSDVLPMPWPTCLRVLLDENYFSKPQLRVWGGPAVLISRYDEICQAFQEQVGAEPESAEENGFKRYKAEPFDCFDWPSGEIWLSEVLINPASHQRHQPNSAVGGLAETSKAGITSKPLATASQEIGRPHDVPNQAHPNGTGARLADRSDVLDETSGGDQRAAVVNMSTASEKTVLNPPSRDGPAATTPCFKDLMPVSTDFAPPDHTGAPTLLKSGRSNSLNVEDDGIHTDNTGEPLKLGEKGFSFKNARIVDGESDCRRANDMAITNDAELGQAPDLEPPSHVSQELDAGSMRMGDVGRFQESSVLPELMWGQSQESPTDSLMADSRSTSRRGKKTFAVEISKRKRNTADHRPTEVARSSESNVLAPNGAGRNASLGKRWTAVGDGQNQSPKVSAIDVASSEGSMTPRRDKRQPEKPATPLGQPSMMRTSADRSDGQVGSGSQAARLLDMFGARQSREGSTPPWTKAQASRPSADNTPTARPRARPGKQADRDDDHMVLPSSSSGVEFGTPKSHISDSLMLSQSKSLAPISPSVVQRKGQGARTIASPHTQQPLPDISSSEHSKLLKTVDPSTPRHSVPVSLPVSSHAALDTFDMPGTPTPRAPAVMNAVGSNSRKRAASMGPSMLQERKRRPGTVPSRLPSQTATPTTRSQQESTGGGEVGYGDISTPSEIPVPAPPASSAGKNDH